MPAFYHGDEYKMSTSRLREHLFGNPTSLEAPHNRLNKAGQAHGTIIGGNLTILCHLIGTSSDVDYKGKILFIEDTGEFLYNIDRMMVQLKRNNKLEQLAGLVVGQFNDLKDTARPFGKTAYEIIREAIDEYSYPVGFDFPIGHIDENYCVQVGVDASLEVNHKSKSVLRYSENETGQQTS
jgi:muramoyltetrapeptide carboxypeptidase